MKQIKALGVSEAWLPFESDAPVTLEGMQRALGQGQAGPQGLV